MAVIITLDTHLAALRSRRVVCNPLLKLVALHEVTSRKPRGCSLCKLCPCAGGGGWPEIAARQLCAVSGMGFAQGDNDANKSGESSASQQRSSRTRVPPKLLRVAGPALGGVTERVRATNGTFLAFCLGAGDGEDECLAGGVDNRGFGIGLGMGLRALGSSKVRICVNLSCMGSSLATIIF